MALDPTTSIGKLRLRVADYSDLPIMPDAVYQSAIDDCSGSLPRAAVLMAQYILGALTVKTHRKIPQMEVWGGEWFDNYVKFLKLTILNPNLMQLAPTPYTGGAETVHPLIQFQEDWNNNYVHGTQSQQLSLTASTPDNMKF